MRYVCIFVFFFFNRTATTEIYTLSLHDALPIYPGGTPKSWTPFLASQVKGWTEGDRKSTRLNSSHTVISYAVFCLKKKKKLAEGVDLSAVTRRTPHNSCAELGNCINEKPQM